MWYLLNQQAQINADLVKEKLLYYNITDFSEKVLLDKIRKFNKKDFIKDLRPFIIFNKRDKLGDLFDYILDYFEKRLERWRGYHIIWCGMDRRRFARMIVAIMLYFKVR